jgi:biopolymer transport protein ExbB/TolQ
MHWYISQATKPQQFDMLSHCSILLLPLLTVPFVWIIITDSWQTSVEVQRLTNEAQRLTNEVQDLRSRLQASERVMQLTSELLDLRAKNMESCSRCPEYSRLQQVEKHAEEAVREARSKESDMMFIIEAHETLISMRMQAHEQRMEMRMEACEEKIAKLTETHETEHTTAQPKESHFNKKALILYRPKTAPSFTTREWFGLAVIGIVSAYIGAQVR